MTANYRAVRQLFAQICVRHKLSDTLELRSCMPKNLIYYQIVDKEGNPLTENILGPQMKLYLKGLDDGMKMKQISN